MVVITIKLKMGRVIGSFLDRRVGGKKVHTIAGSRINAHEMMAGDYTRQERGGGGVFVGTITRS